MTNHPNPEIERRAGVQHDSARRSAAAGHWALAQHRGPRLAHRAQRARPRQRGDRARSDAVGHGRRHRRGRLRALRAAPRHRSPAPQHRMPDVRRSSTRRHADVDHRVHRRRSGRRSQMGARRPAEQPGQRPVVDSELEVRDMQPTKRPRRRDPVRRAHAGARLGTRAVRRPPARAQRDRRSRRAGDPPAHPAGRHA